VESGPSSNQQKYESSNPVQRWLIARFQRRLVGLIEPLGARTVLDAGCGEGYLARALLDALPGLALTGADLSPRAVEAARRRCPEARFEQRSLDDLAAARERYDLVVCSEVLEHLDSPRAALGTLAALTAGHALLTVPWEPWFQLANLARGKYLRTLGNHPEHIQHYGLRGFVAEVGASFEPLAAGVCFPWIWCLARPRR
jgi:2-polyprenyl-3-methyl-5-hydroxy-6-metoxy-1,4-benzoquinol methylase